MVERLKNAIDKARERREKVVGAVPREEAPLVAAEPVAPEADAWSALEEVALDLAHLEQTRVIAYGKHDPAYVAFDLLRTRLLRAFKENGWSRVAISSPTKGCGKTFVSANLALSIARQSELRTVLVDMDLKALGLAGTLGLTSFSSIESYISDRGRPEDFFRRIGKNLAVGLNTKPVQNSSELIQDTRTGEALIKMRELLEPDVEIYDLPPMLVTDDPIAFLPHVDCILLVAGAGQTTADEILECEQLFSGATNYIGVILNKCESTNSEYYQYYG